MVGLSVRSSVPGVLGSLVSSLRCVDDRASGTARTGLDISPRLIPVCMCARALSGLVGWWYWSGWIMKVVPFREPGMGWGLKVAEDVPKNTLVGEYVGEVSPSWVVVCWWPRGDDPVVFGSTGSTGSALDGGQ